MNIFIPDEYPEYPGGQVAFNQELDKNFEYPYTEGVMFHNSEVIVSFIIDRNGNLVSPKIEKSLHPAFDAEVLSAIQKLKKWKPAKYNGEPVCWQIKLPVRFSVKF
jgi:periplasmic protein TonB